MGKKVLMIDMDPQGNLAQHFGLWEKAKHGVYSVIQGESDIADISVEVSDNLTLVPPGEKLVRLESVQMKPGRGLMLRKALEGKLSQFDMVVIDCPPNNGFLVVNAIAAANELLIPVTPDFFGLNGLSEMIKQSRRYERVLGKFEHTWILISRYQTRKVSDEAESKIRHYFGDQVPKQVISERAVVAECPGHGKPLANYASGSESFSQFQQAAKEMLMGG